MAIGGIYNVQNPAYKALGSGQGSPQQGQGGQGMQGGQPPQGANSSPVGGSLSNVDNDVSQAYAGQMKNVMREHYEQAQKNGEYLPDTPENMAQQTLERTGYAGMNTEGGRIALGALTKSRQAKGMDAIPPEWQQKAAPTGGAAPK